MSSTRARDFNDLFTWTFQEVENRGRLQSVSEVVRAGRSLENLLRVSTQSLRGLRLLFDDDEFRRPGERFESLCVALWPMSIFGQSIDNSGQLISDICTLVISLPPTTKVGAAFIEIFHGTRGTQYESEN